MTLIAGLDFGTSSVKLVVLSTAGAVIARAQATYDTHHGPRGVVEQSPEDWWHAARTVLGESGVARDIAAIGLTGQMQDLIPVAEGRALRPAVLYSDTRAAAEHERLLGTVAQWERRTGNHQDVTNVAAKAAWLAEHEPDTAGRAETLLFGAGAYVAWRAGGRAACDPVTASSTGLLDVAERTWFRPAAQAAGIRPDQLPYLTGATPGDTVVGEVSAAAAAELGVPAGIPLVLAMGDAGSTTDGLVGSAPDDAYIYLGTTGWLAAVTADEPAGPSPVHSLVMPGWAQRLRIGALQSAGSAAAWARSTFLPGHDADEAEQRVAERVPDVSIRPLCLPGLAGERTPIRDGAFRGAFVGVHDATRQEDIYLAVLTGVAMGLRHAAEEMGVEQTRIPVVGGGASSPAWRQILADVFDATVVTGAAIDPGCHGAARAAVSALGLDHALMPLLAPGGTVTATAPSASRDLYHPLIETHRALYPALAPTFHRLAV